MKRLIYLIARLIYNLFKSSTSEKYRVEKRVKTETVKAIKRNVTKMSFKRSQPIGKLISIPIGRKGGKLIMQRKRILKLIGHNQYLLINA